MSIAEDRRRVDRARVAGGDARRAGRPQGANPYRGYTPLIRSLHFAWSEGWQQADAEVKAGRRR